MSFKYSDAIYAGVLGKIVGVYLGRPVEGWSYDKIVSTFGEIPYYVHEECGVPLIVADDDISGTFGFFRAIEDNDFDANITAKEIGDSWLNYIIEDKTILWWGGLGRSTEHTAYLNLKNGITAPESGSIKRNGKTLAEQIGAQIFIDAFAMACPNDPEKATRLIKSAASVSHDGLAVEAACFLGAMEAMAFEEKNINKLMDNGVKFIDDDFLKSIIDDVRNICEKQKNWRLVREYLDKKYGYSVYPGCCHMIPNHTMVLASLLLGGDDFQKSIKIATSAAWDTDCNAGNVGALNGIRLGLSAISAGADFRFPVADRMLVVTADGGAVVSDAVIETKKIIKTAIKMSGNCSQSSLDAQLCNITNLTCNQSEVDFSDKRFDFFFKGSVQGFALCPYSKKPYTTAVVSNINETSNENGLLISCNSIGEGINAEVSTPTFIDFSELANNFSTIASPTLYSTQTLTADIKHYGNEEISIKSYILHYDINNETKRIDGEEIALKNGINNLKWTIPETEGMPIFRVGFSISSIKSFSRYIAILNVDWKGAPKHFEQKGMLMTSIWNTNPFWSQIWASSAKHFAADFKYTYCVSHPEKNGIATLGTNDWTDYKVTSKICFSLHKTGGLVLRSKGHRRYYAALMSEYNKLKIVMRKNDEVVELATTDFEYEEDRLYLLEFSAKGNKLEFCVDGAKCLEARDETYSNGGAGFAINFGTMTADGILIEAL